MLLFISRILIDRFWCLFTRRRRCFLSLIFSTSLLRLSLAFGTEDAFTRGSLSRHSYLVLVLLLSRITIDALGRLDLRHYRWASLGFWWCGHRRVGILGSIPFNRLLDKNGANLRSFLAARMRRCRWIWELLVLYGWLSRCLGWLFLIDKFDGRARCSYCSGCRLLWWHNTCLAVACWRGILARICRSWRIVLITPSRGMTWLFLQTSCLWSLRGCVRCLLSCPHRRLRQRQGLFIDCLFCPSYSLCTTVLFLPRLVLPISSSSRFSTCLIVSDNHESLACRLESGVLSCACLGDSGGSSCLTLAAAHRRPRWQANKAFLRGCLSLPTCCWRVRCAFLASSTRSTCLFTLLLCLFLAYCYFWLAPSRFSCLLCSSRAAFVRLRILLLWRLLEFGGRIGARWNIIGGLLFRD